MDLLDVSAKGKRTLVATLDAWADKHPEKVHAYVLRDVDVSQGFRAVTHREIRDAADAFAWWLLDTHGKVQGFPTIAYVGLNDLRYAIVYYGAVKAGYKSMFVSPRNPPAQNASLLQQMDCKHFIHSPEMGSVVKAATALLPGSIWTSEVPVLDHWLERPNKPFPFQKSFEEAKWDPVVVMHSSGSTGAPKPITLNHGYFAASESPMRSIPGRTSAGPSVFDFPGGSSYFTPFPPYHLAGVQSMCNLPVTAFEASVIIGLPDRPPVPQLIYEILKAKRPKALYSPPSLIEAIAQLADGLDVLSSCDYIIYAGGPLSKSCGDALSKVVKLSTVYGSTETGSNHVLLPQPTDWDYLEFHPDFHRRMQPTIDGAYELVFSQEDPLKEKRGISWSHSHLTEYRTRDMFMRHPSNPNLWKFHGRNDDIIVFSTGAKYNPIPAESAILASSKLSGALILGDSREQAALLLEPKEAPTSDTEFIDLLWPDIAKVNEANQKQGRILRSRIAVVEPGGLIRAPKGTVVRKLTRTKFESLINSIYADGQDSSQETLPKFKPSDDVVQAITTFVRESVHSSTTVGDLGDHQDFYVYGLDSVQTTDLCRTLRIGLSAQYGDCSWIRARYVFDYPTINKLSHALLEKLSIPQSNGSQGFSTSRSSPIDLMKSLISKLTVRPVTQSQTATNGRSSEETPQQGLNVILTGSTGSFGPRLLSAFANDASISKITCLDRSQDARDRVSKLHPSLSLDKITFRQARLGEKNLGLDDQVYQSLAKSTDAIVHNAWKVDFNQSIESFEPVHLKGVSNLLTMSSQKAVSPRVFFISSVSAVSNWGSLEAEQSVPEQVVEDPNVAAGTGYGQSKFVGENILAQSCALSKGNLPVTILRVGQIAGPVVSSVPAPAWNQSEWIPAMLYTSKQLGYLPDWLPDLDWVPVDVLSQITHEIFHESLKAQDHHLEQADVYNIVNPRSSRWSDLMRTVQTRFGGPEACKIVSLQEWIAKLKDLDVSSTDVLQEYPAVKIIDFYDTLSEKHQTRKPSKLELRKGPAASKTMANLQAVNSEWMESWMDQWQL